MNTDALSVVRAYHRAWTSKEFDADAALLADELVNGLGPMRIAEHFTVRDGKIVRLRQVHDTAMLRGQA